MQIHLTAEPSVLIPHIGRNILTAFDKSFQFGFRHIVDVGDLLFKTFLRKACSVALCQSDAVVLNVIPAASQNLRNLE